MLVAVSIFAILFGLLHLIAAILQFQSKDPAARGSAIFMACGCISVLAAAITRLLGAGWIICLELLAGCAVICFAAYLNGKRAENFHLSHHIVRGGIAAALVICSAIW